MNLDDICRTRDTVAVRVVSGYAMGDSSIYASYSSNCAGSGPLSATMTATNDL